MPLQTHYTAPDVPDGYPLDPTRGLFSVIIPEATTNLVTNPSLETGTTGWTAVGGSIARSAAQQRRGIYSLAVTPTSAATDGCYFGTVSLTSGTTYTASVDVLGAPGVEYQIFFATTGGASLGTPYRFTGTGRWQRVDVQYNETSSTTRRIYIAKRTGTSTAIFYVDGLQVEAKSYPTTYCDGDQAGFVPSQLPPPYLWTGTAHASTSTRAALTRSGGREWLLSDLGLTVLSYSGLGMAGVANVDDAYAQGDGALYQATYVPARTFAIAGAISGDGFAQVQRKRAALQNAVRPDRGSPRQPLLLRWQNTDGCGNPRGLPLELVCVYAGGLEGETTNRYQERVTLRFTMYDPYLRAAGDSGAALTINSAVTAAGIVQRAPGGAWSALGTGLTGGTSGQARDILTLPSGAMIVVGDFTDAGGSGADYIAQWNGASWAVVGSATALNATALRVRAAPNGTTIYVVGGFTNAGGDANADRIAQWDGSSWSAMGTGAGATMRALAVGPDGTVYAGGDATNIGGVGANYIAKWNGSAWSVLGSGTALDAAVSGLGFGSDGYLYVSGGFTAANGVANTAGIARWDGSAWSSVGNMTGAANDLLAGLDGALYAVGSITAVGGVTVQNVARWNGASWSALGSGTTGTLLRGAIAPDGTLYVTGATTIGGLAARGYARWNGTAWVWVDSAYPSGVSSVTAIEITKTGALTLGLSNAASTAVTAGAVTTVTNAGTADAYPVLSFTGPGTLKTLINYTTGEEIFFAITLIAGETATLDLTPGNISFISTFRGNILSAILPGSNLATWRLAPGANDISLLIDGTTTVATAATLRFRPAYWSVDDGTE